MDIKFNCNSCGEKIVSSDKHKRKKDWCPQCGNEILIPDSSTIDEDKPERVKESPEKEPTGMELKVEEVTKNIISELRPIKGILVFILLATMVTAIISLLVYLDYRKGKKEIEKEFEKIQRTYQE